MLGNDNRGSTEKNFSALYNSYQNVIVCQKTIRRREVKISYLKAESIS